MKKYFYLTLAIIIMTTSQINSQTGNAKKGTVERIKVHGEGLRGNLEGDSPDRSVSVYLPASYKSNPGRRYPVIYFLHGLTDNDAKWYGFEEHWINMPDILNEAFTKGAAREMIVVTPDAYTRFGGSMYSNSINTGNWEEFISRDLVGYIDNHYRTITKKESRGLAGHSMGGYGSLRIGQKYPDIFSCIYLLSPCCLAPNWDTFLNDKAFEKFESIKTFDDYEKSMEFWTVVPYVFAAAWSPDPANPPLYLQLPGKDEKWNRMVFEKWTANMPLTTLDQNISNIRKLHAIAFDAGDKDEPIASTVLSLDSELNKYGIRHMSEIYDGTHVSNIGDRISRKMLKFFSDNLNFDK
jgi:S-formylglutathione hydrolase